MRLILSRKGFDTSSGGCPNPIFPDGSLMALPIPDRLSNVRYRDVAWKEGNLGALVSHLSGGRIKPAHGAHLDPDILGDHYPRSDGWRPLFGQHGAAQGHLRRQSVGVGDLFLFFGLFREVEKLRGRWRFRPGALPHHRIWGWFQAGEIYALDNIPRKVACWASYHPHFAYPGGNNNTLYIAGDRLRVGRGGGMLPAAGGIGAVEKSPGLSDPAAGSPSRWKLPRWFYPLDGKRPLSYHNNPQRWRRGRDCCYLTAASRGQEFVLHCDDYPRAEHWARELIENALG